MFSGGNFLGEAQDKDEDVQDADIDLQTISENYLSPDGGYPANQRMQMYDMELEQHQTLNGSRTATAMGRNFLQLMRGPGARTVVTGAERAHTPAMRPRFAGR